MASVDRGSFGSKIGLILATAGGAVGLGNIWRFPYMAGQNGGAAFILVYVGCILLLGIPCMVSEFVIGRNGNANTARAFTKVAGGTPWKLIGYLGVLTGYLITGYYAVVSGWCLQYIYASLFGHLKGDPTYVEHYFERFATDPVRPIVWTIVMLVISHFIISKGVSKGIERASKIMMPALFVLLLVIVVASCLLPNACKGIEFLFMPDFSKINGGIFLAALGQSFYSLSLAMGCICTYASYFKKDVNLLGSAVQISVIDSIVAILAGLMIFPAAFSVGVSPDSGPSLIFITLPNVFNHAFGAFPIVGSTISVLFYLLLSLAGLSSLLSLHEVSTSFFYEELNISRKKGALIVTISCCIIGIFCSLSLGAVGSSLTFAGKSLFDWFDFITGQIFLPIGGFLTCLFIGWYVPRKLVYDEFTNNDSLKGNLYKVCFDLYLFLVRFVCPICILVIFLTQLGIL